MPGPPAITYRSTDNTRWGTGQGFNLTAPQVDINFWNMVQAIVDLQNNPPTPNNISAITVSGIYMTVTLTDGSNIGPLALPVLQFKWRGAWTPDTPYNQLDVFEVAATGLFSVLLDHTSGATFDPGITVGGQPALNELFGFSGASGVFLADLGDVALVSLANGDRLVYDAIAVKWRNQRPDYVIGGYSPGLMVANQSLLVHRFATAVTIPANWGDYLDLSTQLGGTANASADITITVAHALAASPTSFLPCGFFTIGAGGATFTAASTTGAAPLNFAKGDLLRLGGPPAPDPTFQDFHCSLVAFET
jgi:hypothetical protein